MFHPWRILRGLTTVNVVWTPLTGKLGATNGTTLIYLHPDQSQQQRRSTLTHELAHITLGHTRGCGPAEEALADQLAATWLIPLDDLINAMRWSEHLDEIADDLWVDLATLKTRLDTLTDTETEILRKALEDS